MACIASGLAYLHGKNIRQQFPAAPGRDGGNHGKTLAPFFKNRLPGVFK